MSKAKIEKQAWGETDGQAVSLYTLKSDSLEVKISSYGGIITELHVPDREGQKADVALGFETLEGYLSGHPYFGSLVGRVANRIEKGKFSLDGESYTLATNNGANHLHGGEKGFDKRVWGTQIQGKSLVLSLLSPDGEEGYPGTVSATAVYTLEGNTLRLELAAVTDKPTPVNLTNHSYFNLAGHGAGSILEHDLTLYSSFYTPTDKTSIPTGEIRAVKGSPFDFSSGKAIGKDIKHEDVTAIDGGGYDTNFVVDGLIGTLRPAARLRDLSSGRVLEILTTHPGIQFYSGNFLDGSLKGKGARYVQHGGLALEPQTYPNAVNTPHFPSPVLRPGEVYRQTIEYHFSAA